jgi:nucleotide-binding universal stress UspA family protein
MTRHDKATAAAEALRRLTTRPITKGHADHLNRYLTATLYQEAAHHAEHAAGPARSTRPEDVAQPERKPIVVGFDGSDPSREAVRWAVTEADLRGCPVRAVIVGHSATVAPDDRLPSALPDDLAQWYHKFVTSTVRRTADEMDLPAIEVTRRHGRAPDVLVEISEQAQLLVLGTRGRGHLVDAVLGSVARQCTRSAHCPVVVIPPQSSR